jgi:hypothetical protein
LWDELSVASEENVAVVVGVVGKLWLREESLSIELSLTPGRASPFSSSIVCTGLITNVDNESP